MVIHAPVEYTLLAGSVRYRAMYNSAEAMMTWRIEGYEKLKPYGFVVHGCPDGTYTIDLEALSLCEMTPWNCNGHGFGQISPYTRNI